MKNLAKELEQFLKTEGVEDIIIFGSSAKGKASPSDTDLAVLMKEENSEIKKAIKEILPDADIQLITIKDIYKNIFITLIKEGFSVKKGEYLHNLYSLSPVKIYTYDLKQLTLSKKVMFDRGIKSVKGITRMSNKVVMVPIEHTGEFEDFLKQWNLDIDTKEYELLPILRKEES